MPLTPRSEPRRKSSPRWVLGFWLVVIALRVWPVNHVVALVLFAIAAVLLLGGLRRATPAPGAGRSVETVTMPVPAPDARPIEPDVGGAGGKLVVLALVLLVLGVLLVLVFRPHVGALRGSPSYRVEAVSAEVAPPLQPGDVVCFALVSAPARTGEVVALSGASLAWRFATVLAAPGETRSGDPPVDWVVRDELDQVRGTAHRVRAARLVAADSLVVTTRSGAARPEAEMIPAALVKGKVVAIVFPPSRWKRLP